MELWYTDEHTSDVRFSMKASVQVASKKSAVQQIDILDTPAYGRVLVLDGGLMITEKDEFIYHEMITHVPMAVNPNVKNVLVIGGGDGGTVRELTKYRRIETIDLVTKYRRIESIDLVEVDKDVVLLAKKFLPFTSCKLKDKRVSVWFEEGLRYVRGKKAEYDLIIVDSSDPYGPAEGLFTREFYGTCYKALRDDGILINPARVAVLRRPPDVREKRPCPHRRGVPRLHRVPMPHPELSLRTLALRLRVQEVPSDWRPRRAALEQARHQDALLQHRSPPRRLRAAELRPRTVEKLKS